MSIITSIQSWFSQFFKSEAQQEFNITPMVFPSTETAVSRCFMAYQGRPDWVDPESNVKTINFAKAVCSEIARLVTLGISIKVDGSPRAEYLQGMVDRMFYMLRRWDEYGNAYGLVILKPNLDLVELYTPGEYTITDTSGGEITGAVFRTTETSRDGKKFYTRLEYHSFDDDGLYHIENRCYVSSSATGKGEPIAIDLTPWAGLKEESTIEGLEKPLFAVLRTPGANNRDINAPLALPIFADAMEELKDLDIAYSRNAKEIFDSARTVLLDSDRLLPSLTAGGIQTPERYRAAARKMKLPDYVRVVEGDGTSAQGVYQEINPTLNTDARLTGLNALLSQIGYKCGFSNGYFVFNEKTGLATATQVEADQQRTIQLIKDCRDQLESCLDGLLYALDKLADLYDLAPAGAWEVNFDFGDITYNRDEDRARWLSYANGNKVPFWYYLTKFEGFTEEEARALVEQAQPEEPTLFGSEE